MEKFICVDGGKRINARYIVSFWFDLTADKWRIDYLVGNEVRTVYDRLFDPDWLDDGHFIPAEPGLIAYDVFVIGKKNTPFITEERLVGWRVYPGTKQPVPVVDNGGTIDSSKRRFIVATPGGLFRVYNDREGIADCGDLDEAVKLAKEDITGIAEQEGSE